MRVRDADRSDELAVRNVLDGAMLRRGSDLTGTIEGGNVLVAVREQASGDGAVVGALVLDGQEIVAVAVRRRQRGRGVGTALVERAATDRGRLLATFRGGVCPFWESVAETVTRDGERCRATIAETKGP